MKAVKYQGKLWIQATKSHTIEQPVLDVDKSIDELKTALQPFVKFKQETDEIPASGASADPVLGLTWQDFVEAEKTLKGLNDET